MAGGQQQANKKHLGIVTSDTAGCIWAALLKYVFFKNNGTSSGRGMADTRAYSKSSCLQNPCGEDGFKPKPRALEVTYLSPTG